ncbi:MAG: hypothetical protein LBR16_05435 [Treponema sp.]|jgi:hypothetical protein|nr:hypothetical protein [Treponema sp.]
MAETDEELEAIAKGGGAEMGEAVKQMRYLAGTSEFLYMETLRELARLDEGQKLSNAEQRGALQVLNLLESGRTPDEIRRMYTS